MTVIAYTPLERGLLSGKYHRHPELVAQKSAPWRVWIRRHLERTRPLVAALEEIGAGHNATAAQVALNWVVSFHGDTIVTIPGATRISQAEEAAGAMTFRLTETELSRLDGLSK